VIGRVPVPRMVGLEIQSGVDPDDVQRMKKPNDCRHGLSPEWCATCQAAGQYGPQVYISLGGSTFHRSPDCLSLEDGQSKVERSGRQVAPIEQVAPARAISIGRRPCLTCFE
jgi:hypothetical protein